MKKFLSIFLTISLFTSALFLNDTEEVAKIPCLISHYFDHQSKAGDDFDFIDYLVLHYKSPHSKEKENTGLPFFQHSFPSMAFTITPLFELTFDNSPKSGFHFFLYINHYTGRYSLSLCQPPRAA